MMTIINYINPFGGGLTSRRHLEDERGNAQHILAGKAVRRCQEMAMACVSMGSIEDVEAFDITQGYPEKLVF